MSTNSKSQRRLLAKTKIMPATNTIYIRLLNACVTHKAEPAEIISLLAFNAFVEQNNERLHFWRRMADVDMHRRLRFT